MIFDCCSPVVLNRQANDLTPIAGVYGTLGVNQQLPMDMVYRLFPALILEFAGAQALDPRITFTRADASTCASYFNSSGVLTLATANTPRFDYDPVTLQPKGLLIEESRTNSIRNNTMVDAVAGTPGTLPTNWTTSGVGTLTQTVVGTGTINGINYIDVRFNGTTSSTQVSVRFDTSSGIGATNGQTWNWSAWTALVGGSTTNISGIGVYANLYDSVPTFLSSINFSGVSFNTSTSTMVRTSGTGTIATASTAFIQPQLTLLFSSGVAIDITVRIGMPQLEQGSFATSVIPTTTAAVTRAADSAVMTGTNFSSWFNASAGTFYAEWVLGGDLTSTCVLQVDDGTGNEVIRMRYNAGGTANDFAVIDGGVAKASLSGNQLTPGTIYRAAGAYAVNDFARSQDGAAATTDTAGTLPTVTAMGIGMRSFGGEQLGGHIRRIAYFNRRLSNAELQAITA